MALQSILLMIHVLTALALIGLVLIQQGRGADAGAAFGSGSAGTVFGSRGPTTFLTRLTAMLAVVFFVTSLALVWLTTRSIDRDSVVERVEQPAGEVPEVPAGAPSDVPAAPGGSEGAGDDLPALPTGSGQ